MNLIYYYQVGNGAPSKIANSLFNELLANRKKLPFDDIKLYCKKKYTAVLKNKYPELEILTYKSVNKESRQDIVHIPILPTIIPNTKFFLYIYSKLIKKSKLIVNYHGDVRTELKSSYKDITSLTHILTYIFIPTLLKCADRVIVNSYKMDRIIEEYGVKNRTIIPNAIEHHWFYPLNLTEITINNDINKDKFNVFYHGRFSWEKGIDLLLEAAGSCIKHNPNIMIYLAGNGPQENYLRKLCSTLNIDENVIFLGHKTEDEIKFFLKNVDAAIYPSRFDAFCLASLEALACAECPVYFSKNAGIYDFAIRDKIELNYFDLSVENIRYIFNSDVSHKKAAMIIDIQKNYAKNYRWEFIIDKYIETYKEVIES